MNPRFKYGDKVLAGNHRATVISVIRKGVLFICRVKFDNKLLMPPEMEYEEMYLKFYKPHGETCPVCGDRWKVVKFNMHVWKDCVKCGKKQEDLIKENEVKTSKPDSDLLKEFEKMLDDSDKFVF